MRETDQTHGASRFDLEKAVAAWRSSLERHPAFLEEDLDELERHLRDQVDAAAARGEDVESAFRAARREMGHYGRVEAEYEKVYWGKVRRRGDLATQAAVRLAALRGYVTTSIRSARRQPVTAAINVIGLALGVAASLVIALHVRQELTIDADLPNADSIFRVVHEDRSEGDVERSARSVVPLGPALRETYPDIEGVVRFWRGFQVTLSSGDRVFQEAGLYFADPAALDMFSLELIQGDPATALDAPGSIVLTESSAERYFGSEDPVGRLLRYEGYPAGTTDVTVTGVMPDLPPDTHLSFTALASMSGVETEAENTGSWKPIWTYVQLSEGQTRSGFEKKLADFRGEFFGPSGEGKTFLLEPVRSIHLDSPYAGGFKEGGSRQGLLILAGIGWLILVIAGINFVNLSTVQAARRSREIGMRKVLGARRSQLAWQFLGEAVLVVTVAGVIALGLVLVALPAVNARMGSAVVLGPGDVDLLLGFLGGVLILGFATGLYPALKLSRGNPIGLARSRTSTDDGGSMLRHALVIVQFTISIALITGTLIIRDQLEFVRTQDIGVDRERIVVLPHADAEEAVLAEIRSHPNVESVGVSQRVPVSTINSDGRPVTPEGFAEPVGVDSYIIGDGFVETYGVNLVAGRALSLARPADSTNFMINETAAARFGWTPDEAVGRALSWQSEPGRIVGVIRDFNLDSFREPITPLVLQTRPSESWWRTFISVKLGAGDARETLAHFENAWRTYAPADPFTYFFLDESLEHLHAADLRLARMFGAFSFVAILIACLGLFGLAMFVVRRRYAEIGIRKVLGATAPQILALVSGRMLTLVAVSAVVASVIAWIGAGRWLEQFVYRVDIGPGPFVMATAIVLGVAVATIAWQALKAAWLNPVDAIGRE